jgi:hypothetical protein
MPADKIATPPAALGTITPHVTESVLHPQRRANSMGRGQREAQRRRAGIQQHAATGLLTLSSAQGAR